MARIIAVSGGGITYVDGHAIGIPNIIDVGFNYLTYDGYPLGEIEANEIISTAGIHIIEAFNDPTATLSLGDDSDHVALMEPGDVDVTAVGYYEVSPVRIYLAAAYTRLYIDRKAATSGRGMIYLFVEF